MPSYFSDQIRQKWKNLKRLYNKKKQEMRPSGESAIGMQWVHYEQMDRLLGSRPRAQVCS